MCDISKVAKCNYDNNPILYCQKCKNVGHTRLDILEDIKTKEEQIILSCSKCNSIIDFSDRGEDFDEFMKTYRNLSE